jgi:hypothetical protein
MALTRARTPSPVAEEIAKNGFRLLTLSLKDSNRSLIRALSSWRQLTEVETNPNCRTTTRGLPSHSQRQYRVPTRTTHQPDEEVVLSARCDAKSGRQDQRLRVRLQSDLEYLQLQTCENLQDQLLLNWAPVS